MILGFVGNPDFGAETLTQGSVGYRAQVGAALSIDVVAFRGEYDGLATAEPLDPVFVVSPETPHVLAALHNENLLDATTRGLEVSGEWAPLDAWRLHGSYSWLRLTPRVDGSSRDEAARSFDGNAPRAQWQGHASYRPSAAFRIDASVYRVGSLRQLGIPAYTRVDARAERQIAHGLSASVAAQNLFEAAHAEFSGITLAPALIPRSWHAQLRWTFQ